MQKPEDTQLSSDSAHAVADAQGNYVLEAPPGALPGSALNRILPPVTYSQAAIEGISDVETALLDAYLRQVVEFWGEAEYAVTSVHIDIVIDVEESTRSIVTSHVIDASADEAMQYWDDVGDALDGWATIENSQQARKALDLISTNVIWRL